MITEIAFVAYPVSDMKRARRFYEQTLGLKLESNFQDEWIEYAVSGGTFAITTMDVHHPPGRHGAIIAFEVDDLDATRQSLRKQNAKFLSEVVTTPVCRSFAVADPDGNEVILHRRNGQAL